jgi:hypothetical protein
VGYTDIGVVLITNAISKSLEKFFKRGLFKSDFTIFVPKVADQSSTDRNNRYFPGITFTANLVGAIHKLGVTGTVSP